MKNDLINQIEVNSVSDALDILKAAGTEDLFEKGKWKVGDEKVYQGVTYYVSDFNAKGTPKWRKKKGEGKPSGPSSSGNNNGSNKRNQIKDYFDEINAALNRNGYYAHLTTSGSIEVYEKGKRISMKNLKASIMDVNYMNFGPNVGLKDKITSIVKEAVNKKDNEKTASKNNKTHSSNISEGTVDKKSTKTTKTNKSFDDVTKEYVNAFGNERYSKTKASKELTDKYVNTLSDDSKTRSAIKKVLSAQLKNESYGTTKYSMEQITKTINASLSRFSSLAEADKYMRDYISKRIKSGKGKVGWTDKDLKGAKVSMSVDGWFILGNRHGGGYKFNPKNGGMYTY